MKGYKRIFLSSPQRGFAEYRKAAKQAIGKFQQVYDDFTEWPSDEGSPLEVSLKRVRRSDLLIIVLAHRYGATVEGLGGRSITHAEFDEAIKLGIPVRAFFVDPNYPWLVKDVDPDSQRVSKFKEYVKRFCAPSFFGSVESLEIEISRSLLEILISEGLNLKPEVAKLVRPEEISSLSARSEGSFIVGKSIDNLPVAVCTVINRSKLRYLEGQINRLLSSCQIESPHQLSKRMIDGATNVARDKAKENWECKAIDSPRANTYDVFVVQDSAALREMYSGVLDSFTNKIDTTRTGVVNPAETTRLIYEDENMETKYKSTRVIERARLGLGISKTGKTYVLAKRKDDWAIKREFVTETMKCIEDVGYVIRLKPYEYKRDSLLSIAESSVRLGATLKVYGAEISYDRLSSSYQRFLDNLRRDSGGIHLFFDDAEQYKHALKNPDLNTSSSSTSTYVAISTYSLVKIIIEAAEVLANDSDHVHGNIKPGNIFVTDSGIQLVDGWNVEVGKPTPFLTDVWASPEQVLGEGIDSATDVFSLCKTLVAVLNLQLSGELITYRVPKWDSPGDHEFQFLAEPYIQYRHNTEIREFPDRKKLRKLLLKGLAGRRKERINTVAELLVQLRDIDFSKLNHLRRLAISPILNSYLLRHADGDYSAFRWIKETIELDPEFEKEKAPRQHRDSSQTIVLDADALKDLRLDY